MSSAPKLTRQMTMITHFIFTEFFVTDVTKSGINLGHFVMHSHYHTVWELKLFIPFFDVLFKCVYKYLCNIVKSNWFLRIEYIVKTLYVVAKSAGDVFLILLRVALIRVWLACWQLWREGFKICIYYTWEPHWPIVIFKTYFRSLFGKFNFDCFIWFTILIMKC